MRRLLARIVPPRRVQAPALSSSPSPSHVPRENSIHPGSAPTTPLSADRRGHGGGAGAVGKPWVPGSSLHTKLSGVPGSGAAVGSLLVARGEVARAELRSYSTDRDGGGDYSADRGGGRYSTNRDGGQRYEWRRDDGRQDRRRDEGVFHGEPRERGDNRPSGRREQGRDGERMDERERDLRDNRPPARQQESRPHPSRGGERGRGGADGRRMDEREHRDNRPPARQQESRSHPPRGGEQGRGGADGERMDARDRPRPPRGGQQSRGGAAYGVRMDAKQLTRAIGDSEDAVGLAELCT
ncbi:hypothetical protein T484DRAFT_1850265 [Baffinella frigidus]|nr:hypothetical protein T484DRAFT_1850265 [Cryptophyta sp. CCMP2293]